MAEKEFTTITRHDDPAPESSKDRVVDLKLLNPDSDGDGKVNPSEKAVYDTLVGADVDKDGYLSINEFYSAMASFSAVQRSRQLFKHALAGVTALFLLQTAVVAVLVVVVAVVTKDSYVASTTGRAMATDANNDVIGYTEALVGLPLIVAPVLELQKLYNVRSIGVKYHDPDAATTVYEGMRVAGVRKLSDTKVIFFSEVPGRRLEINDGAAFVVVDVSVPAGGNSTESVPGMAVYPVCYADASCSAITAEAEDEAALIQAANDALEAAGLPRAINPSDGRRLQALADIALADQQVMTAADGGCAPQPVGMYNPVQGPMTAAMVNPGVLGATPVGNQVNVPVGAVTGAMQNMVG